MDRSLRAVWGGIFTIIVILTIEAQAFDCKNVDRKKCYCSADGSPVIQCPMEDPKIILSLFEKKYVKLQCSLDKSDLYLDLNFIPDLNISDATQFEMEFCPINNSFSEVLRKFGIQNLNGLVFESTTQKDSDLKMNITKDSFQNMQSLRSLAISFNNIHFTTDFLANTPNLVTLELNRNSMAELERYFKYTPNLKMLQLTGNQIHALPDAIFEDLSNLTILYLYRNNLTSLSRKAFRGLNNLKLLEVSFNSIEELAEDTFEDLYNLVNVSLRGNHIKTLYGNTFRNNTMLENIRLGYNYDIIISDYGFANLTTLRTIELSSNKLKDIAEHTFKNCTKLEELILNSNQLSFLNENVFRDLKKLRVLDLSENRLTTFPDEVFSSLETLEILKLSKNKLSVINKTIFKNLGKLKRLELRRNLINTIDPRSFFGVQSSLTHLDIAFNKWNNTYDFDKFIFDSPALNCLVNIEELNLSHNEIREIPQLFSSTKLRKLDFSYNQIDQLQVISFIRATSFQTEIDLSNNRISYIDFRAAEAFLRTEKELNHATTIVKLMNNPIVCNCSIYDLVRYNNGEMESVRNLVNLDQGDLVCSDNNETKVADLKPEDIECPVLNECPDLCTCSFKPYKTAIVVDCSFNNLTSYPMLNFQNVSRYNHTELNLKGNKLTRGPSVRDANYTNITRLDLSDNLITEFHWIPPQIKELNLDDNQIQNLDSRFLNLLKNTTALERLHLKGNPWECSCKSLDFQKYLMQYYSKVDLSDVYCEKARNQLVKLTDLCKVSPLIYALLPAVLTIFLFFAVTIALYYRYETEIKVYLYSKNFCLWFVTDEEIDKNKTFDVFISYSHEDEKFVVDTLLPELEHGERPFKVCIHMRDWVPGEYIAEQVVNSVKDSRRTLVVLSNNFIASEWGRLEFQTAHSEAMTEGRSRVIVVIYGALDEEKVYDELKSYLKTNTYLKWGDKYFWNKLRYALPHSRGNYERNKKHAKTMLKIDDKFDLIANPPSPTNTSTPPITLDPSLLESKDLKINMPMKTEGEAPLMVKQM